MGMMKRAIGETTSQRLRTRRWGPALLFALVFAPGTVPLLACGGGDDAGDKLDEAVEEVQDEAHDAKQELEDEIDDRT